MFFASKLLSAFTQPLTWAVVLLLLALWWLPRRPIAARWALLVAIGLTALVGWMPLPNALLCLLESQYAVPDLSTAPYRGMVVLGGGIAVVDARQGRSRFVLNEAAERMTVPVELQRQHPHLLILFTAGEIDPESVWNTSANPAQQFYESMGVPPERVLYERAARTTYENAILSAALPGVDKTQPWLLVTSAWHMPRSMALFRAAGWNVTPYPVDFRSGSHTPCTDYSLARGALRWQLVLHECLGLAAYAVAGRAAVF